MRGVCLCGGIEFEVLPPVPRLYRCHCSLCRKQGGSSSNASLVIPAHQLRWISAQDLVRSYIKPTGFRSDFCSLCGSPVPSQLRSSSLVWVPAGLLEGGDALEVGAHLFLGSRASWDQLPSSGARYETAPPFRELMALLRSHADA